ncbi:hypothetical protein [Vagococcus fluvialis]|uniref:hypothetical protein n=1 Tax=Vagococcus fluvialis TaxID=2738 RepID=UPI003B58D178
MTKRKVKKSNSSKQQTGLTKKKKQIIASIVLLLLLVGGGIAYKVMNKPSNQIMGGNFLPEGKDAKQMSKEELAKAAQKAVDESEFTLSILPEASFPDGKSKGNIYIKNEANNAFPISVEVVENKSGDVIYESGAIEPGFEVTEGTLSKDLPKGKYECTAKVSIYDPKTKEFKGQTAAEMEVEVKN